MKREAAQEESKFDKRRRLEDYLEARRIYDDLNDLTSEKERSRHFSSLMSEIITG
jgi:hypothetical protein